MSQAKPTVIVAARLPEDLREKVTAQCEVIDVPPGKSLLEAVPADQLANVQGIVCTVLTRIDAAVLKAMPKLQVSSNFAVGFDNVDVAAADAQGVLICNTPGVLDGAVADIALGLMLCLGRNMVAGDEYVRSGKWATQGAFPLTRDIRGKTLGLLGMGRIGRVVAKTAQAFDMKVVYHNRSHDTEAEAAGLAEYRERDALFQEADFVSVHVPLTPETKGSIGAREFGLMKSDAYLINTARGAVVDEAALIKALQDGTIAGAGLDVMEKEPLPADSPLCQMPNVVLQAHIGSATVETRRAMIDLATENLLDALAGTRPRAMVNPKVWDSRQGNAQ